MVLREDLGQYRRRTTPTSVPDFPFDLGSVEGNLQVTSLLAVSPKVHPVRHSFSMSVPVFST